MTKSLLLKELSNYLGQLIKNNNNLSSLELVILVWYCIGDTITRTNVGSMYFAM